MRAARRPVESFRRFFRHDQPITLDDQASRLHFTSTCPIAPDIGGRGWQLAAMPQLVWTSSAAEGHAWPGHPEQPQRVLESVKVLTDWSAAKVRFDACSERVLRACVEEECPGPATDTTGPS